MQKHESAHMLGHINTYTRDYTYSLTYMHYTETCANMNVHTYHSKDYTHIPHMCSCRYAPKHKYTYVNINTQTPSITCTCVQKYKYINTNICTNTW